MILENGKNVSKIVIRILCIVLNQLNRNVPSALCCAIFEMLSLKPFTATFMVSVTKISVCSM